MGCGVCMYTFVCRVEVGMEKRKGTLLTEGNDPRGHF